MPGDGGRILAEAADALEADRSLRQPYRDLAEGTRGNPKLDLPLYDRLVEAADYRRLAVFDASPGDLIHYDRDTPRLDVLADLANAANRHAGYLASKAIKTDALDGPDGTRARDLARGVFALGHGLATEAVTYRSYRTGTQLMQSALGVLAGIELAAGNSSRGQQLRSADEALSAFMAAEIGPAADAIKTLDQTNREGDDADEHFGDVLAVATMEDAATMWRVEALLRLGRYRHAADRAADRAAADRVVREVAEPASDRRVRLAAEAAAGLTLDEVSLARV